MNWNGKGVKVEYYDVLDDNWVVLNNGNLDYFNTESSAIKEYRKQIGGGKLDESNWKVTEIDINTSTNQVAEEALKNGKDGAIIFNVIDGPEKNILGNDYITINMPNQIKSATENNGEYSNENNDIRFSKKPRRLLINEDLSIDEKIAIKKYIESLPENIDYSRPLSFLNNDYIYIFNPNLGLYEDNIKKGDGFEILRKYNINKFRQHLMFGFRRV